MMRKLKVLGSLILLASMANGHHAMEYIALESYTTAPRGAFVFHLHHDYMVDDVDRADLDHWELTPGLSYGILDRLMMDVHSHFAKFGAGHIVSNELVLESPLGPPPFMEAVALSLQYRLTQGAPVEVAVVLGYEHPFQRSRDLLHGQEVLAGTLILSRSFPGHRNALFNLSVEQEAGETNYTWGLGLRTPLTPDAHGIAAGLEFLGDNEGQVSLLPGIYFPLGMQDIVFKTGIEFVPGAGATRSNLTLMYLF